jgi:hypothetical protein
MMDSSSDAPLSRRDLLKAASLAAVGTFAFQTPSFAAVPEGTLLGEFLTPEKALEGLSGNTGLHWAWSSLADREGLVGSGAGEPLKIDALDPAFPGTDDFTISVRLHTVGSDAETVGDILTKFDPASRVGFQLGIITNAGVTNAQANVRQVQFGLDSGTEPVIQDCGRPGNNVYIFSLISHKDELYCSTCEPNLGEAGHVYRYADGDQWEDCGSPDLCNAVSALASFNGELFAGTAKYNLSGSKLTPSMNENRGGGIYRYLGDRKWEDCGRIGESPAVFGLMNYRGTLVASSLYAPAGVYAYAGGQKWNFLGTAPDNKRVEAMTVYKGQIYGTGFNAGEIYRYEGGTTWKTVGVLPETTQTYGFAIYGGELYVSTWPTAIVYRYVSDGVWEPCGRPGMELESMPLAVYNGKMYTGTLPLGELYRYDGGSAWGRIAQLDTTPDVTFRRAWSMAVHRGKLYCGTLPSGHVYSIQVGQTLTADLPDKQGWQHLAVVRKGGELRLYLDGHLSAKTVLETGEPLNLANGLPWIVGGGNHSPLRGGLRDLQIFRTALEEEAIHKLGLVN